MEHDNSPLLPSHPPLSTEDLPLHSPIQPHLDTLFAEFARSRPRISPPRSPVAASTLTRRLSSPTADKSPPAPPLDLRALDYAQDYDSHLMCPICHVPFIDPVVLECDHTFCQSCLTDYRDGASSDTRTRCPTCRAFLWSAPRKASRLIVNMCHEIKVHCPNDGCTQITPRGFLQRHATAECPHQRLKCPDAECDKLVRRKNFVPDQCVHTTHVECDCGAVIELGRGDWLRHKDDECPNTGAKCQNCDKRVATGDSLDGSFGHVCNTDDTPTCPGQEFGCSEDIEPDHLESHTRTCAMAKLAPHLQKQDQLLKSLQEQLTMAKVRNEVLENGFEKIHEVINDNILPRISPSDQSGGDNSDVEEIERDEIPSATSHRDLLMPAHLRALTPSPDPELSSISQTQQHMLALHESLRGNVTNLEQDISALANQISDLDARTSMHLMNETLRIKEDLAHTNAALFSTRAQVQWLLNRERMGAQQQAMGIRGRAPSAQPPGPNMTSSARSSMSEGTDAAGQGSSSENQPSSSNVAPSPNFRPQVRRLSGSQERVKL